MRRRGRGENYQCFGDENDPEVSLYRIYAIYAGWLSISSCTMIIV